MKKFLILIAAILFGISASFAQGVYTVNVSWNQEYCDCEGTVNGSYFKVEVKVYDDANGEWAEASEIGYTSDARPDNLDVPVPDVGDYCDESHPETPSFTVYATVWLMCDATNPPTSVCTGSANDSPYSCHYMYNNTVDISVGYLQ